MKTGMCARTQAHGLAPWGLGASLRRVPRCAPPVTCLLRPVQKLARAPGRAERQAPLQPKQVGPKLPTWVPAAGSDGDWAIEKGYQLSTAVFLAFGAFILVNPGKCAELTCKACMTEVPKHILRIMGAQLILMATFCYRLQAAVGDGSLGDAANQNMAGALSLERILSAVNKYIAVKDGLAVSTAFLVYSYGVPALLTALYFLAYNRLPLGLSVLTNAWESVKSLVNASNKIALGYSAIAVAAILGIIDCAWCGGNCASRTLMSWGSSVQFGTAGKVMAKACGLAFVYAAVAAFNLRAAAESGSLNSDANRTVNLGLLASMVAMGATKGWYAYTNNVNPSAGLVFAVLVVLFSGYNYVNE